MRTFQCFVLLGLAFCVEGIRVPTVWNHDQRNAGDVSYESGAGHRFGVAKPQEDLGESRTIVDNGAAKPLPNPTLLYNPFQSEEFVEPTPRPTKILDRSGPYILPQNSEVNTNLPPLLNPRYSTEHETKRPNSGKLKVAYEKPQKWAQKNNEAYDKYQVLPSDVSRIKPVNLEVPAINTYSHQWNHNYNPGLYKDYSKTPAIAASLFDLPNTQSQLPPGQPLNQHVPQNNKFVVSASEDGPTSNPLRFPINGNVESIEFTTKKEPVFFVTEGYRNVLVQGPNKKRKYIANEHERKDESKPLPVKQESEDEDEDEEDDDEKPPKKRKVTKIYKIHGNEDKESNTGRSQQNFLHPGAQKLFESPSNERNSRLENQLVENYRDDRLHEPSEDRDTEREDDDYERIPDDDERDDTEEDEDDIKPAEKLKTDNSDDKDNSNSESTSNDNEEESDEDESNEEEETDKEDDEKEEEVKVPHSEHADPKPIPTKPVYPGLGQWAKPGTKHRPYVSQHRFLKPIEDERKPDGYDLFEDLEKFFEKQKGSFANDFGQKTNKPVNTDLGTRALPIKSPNEPNPIVIFDPFSESSIKRAQAAYKQQYGNNPTRRFATEGDKVQATTKKRRQQSDDRNDEQVEEAGDEQSNSGEATTEFVPVRLYTQVRNSEDVAHEPRDPAKHGRLKELIKDSKVQTVYSEEGYEDSAYDHAGHEKKAEKDQGYAAFDRAQEEQGKPKTLQEKDNHGGHTKKVIISDKPLVDSVASESIYPLQPKVNNLDITDSFSEHSSKSGNSNNFLTSQELKTTQVTDKANGDVQLEIESEVKVILQPNNSTKAHKYVKIYPKLLKDISKKPIENEAVDKANKHLDILKNITKTVADQINGTNHTNIYQQINELVVSTAKSNAVSDVESSTKTELGGLETSAKPKVVVKVLGDDGALTKISDHSTNIGSRRKRDADDSFEDVNIDEEFIDFIDKVNHTFEPPRKTQLDLVKYPYYTMPDINKNSPLRYAENMENIPIKRAGELSFYSVADKMECPDLPQDIDPVADRTKHSSKRKRKTEESDDEDEEDDDEVEDEEEKAIGKRHPPPPKEPRIKLGDKIDCLKVRYFGENPLDSPFFKEETVGPVLPIFKELSQNDKTHDNSLKSTDIIENINDIFNQKKQKDRGTFETEAKDKIANTFEQSANKIDEDNKAKDTNAKRNTLYSIENDGAESIKTSFGSRKHASSDNSLAHTRKPTPSPLVTLITTPKYTIQLTPNNIYDQIKLLDHLPEDDADEEVETTTKRLETTTVKRKIEKPTEAVSKKLKQVERVVEPNRRQSKVLAEVQKADVKRVEVKRVEEKKVEEKKAEEKKVEGKKVEDKKVVNKVEDVVGEPEALRRRKLRPRRPIYQIFDVTRFLTTTPFSVIKPAASTILPRHKVISEVFYKDEIKPNEQLNVFADVLNNIKNSTHEPLPIEAASDFAEPNAFTVSSMEESVVVPMILHPPTVRVKKFQKDGSNHKNSLEDDIILPQKASSNIQKHRHVTKPPNRPVLPKNKRKPKQPNQSTSQPTSTSTTKLNSRKISKRRRKPTSTTTIRTTTNIHVPDQNTPSNHQPYVIDFIEDSDEVVGLVPPQNFHYRTIVLEDSEVKDSNDVPETIYPPLPVTETIANTNPAPVTEINDEPPTKRPLNKYYFVGLKPPVHQRARPYSEFNHNNIQVNNNLLRRRVAHVGQPRAKREAARPTYADVSRNRGSQTREPESFTSSVDDFDDYVPHRPKNYHYDEKTGQIVYHNKPAENTKEEEEEVEYEEIPDTPGLYLERAEGATHPTPEKVTTKVLLATATPPPEGKGLLDFVAKLKNNPTYKYIPDPSTLKPGSVASTTEGFVTVDPKSTDPPEFLSILSKVKHDKTYKYIEDPKESESKTKSKSTTPPTESDEEDDDEEEEDEESPPGKHFSRKTRQTIGTFKIFNIGDFLPKIQSPISSIAPTNFFKKHVVERIFPRLRYMTLYDIARDYYKQTDLYKFIKKHVQNSPGGQNQELSNIQIFNIGDYLPKIKTITPKTTVDYSKYKTIERPHTRHNISSKYNAEEEEEETERKEEVASRPPPEADEAIVNESKERGVNSQVLSEEKVHDVSSTTQRIVQLRRGTRPTTQRSTVETAESAEAASTRRSANRKRPLPSGFRSTRRPTSTTEVTEATEHVERIYPENYSTASSYPDNNNDKAKRVYRRRPVRIRYTTERQEEDDDTVDRIVRRSVGSEFDDVPDRFEQEYLDEASVAETYEAVKDEILHDDSDKVKIENKEVGSKGNERKKREVLTATPKDVEIMKTDYDQTKKHGGNYRRGNEEEEEESAKETESEEESKDKTENTEAEGRTFDDNKKAETVNENKKEHIQIINKNYDKKKKHGGNYRSEFEEGNTEFAEDETVAKIVEDTGPQKKSDVDIVNKQYDKNKKHGGNYKSEEEAVIDDLLETPEESLTIINKKQLTIDPESANKDTQETSTRSRSRVTLTTTTTTSESPKEISKLSDIVPKPDHFYSDPELPNQVNKLGSEKPPVKLASEELDQIAQEGDLVEEKRKPDQPLRNLRRRKFDEEKEVIGENVSTKKPLFIKDPSKRLYYYVKA